LASITEILTLVVIIIGILILPKMFRKNVDTPSKKRLSTIHSLSVPVRLGITLSILIPTISAIIYQPWKDSPVLFVLTGIIPLIAGWGLYWMLAGFKNKTKSE